MTFKSWMRSSKHIWRITAFRGQPLPFPQGGEVVYSTGYGIAGLGRPMTADTPMIIGAHSKSFTALAIMQLVEAGKIDLDAPIQRYIPWLTVADPQANDQITVRSLLNHTSGLSEAGFVPNLPDSTTLEQAVRELQRAHPTAPADRRYQYFNMGYTTLGYLVGVVFGQKYAQYLEEYIFEPFLSFRWQTCKKTPSEERLLLPQTVLSL